MALHVTEFTRYSISGTSHMDSFLPCIHIQVICNPGICPAGAFPPLSKAFFATPGLGAGTQAINGPQSSIFGKRNTNILFRIHGKMLYRTGMRLFVQLPSFGVSQRS